MGETLAFTYQALGRWLAYACVLALIGIVTFRFAVEPAVRRSGVAVADWKSVDARITRVGWIAAGGIMVATLWRLWAQTYAVFGLDERVSLELIKIVMLDTSWGSGWLAQMTAAAAVAGAFWASAKTPPMAWIAAAVALLAGATMPLTGHAVSQVPPVIGVVLQGAHVVGAGVWLGTLGVVLVMMVATQRRPGQPAAIAAAVHAFSPVALIGAGVLVVSGLVTAVLYLSHFRDLWATAYGLVLLSKFALFLGVAAFGAYNWRVLRPSLGSESATNALQRSAAIELLVGTVVLVVTAVLVALPLAE